MAAITDSRNCARRRNELEQIQDLLLRESGRSPSVELKFPNLNLPYDFFLRRVLSEWREGNFPSDSSSRNEERK